MANRRWLPTALQPPMWLQGLNLISAIIFLGLGIKGYWDNENRLIAVGSMLGLLVIAMCIASIRTSKRGLAEAIPVGSSGEQIL